MKRCTKFCDAAWGFSSDSPNWEVLIDSAALTRLDLEYLQDVQIGNPAFASGVTYTLLAAKVPTAYPYGCNPDPPMSTADPRNGEQWSASIATLVEVHEVEEPGVGEPPTQLQNAHYAHWSRVIYLDGYQFMVVYGVTSEYTPQPSGVELEVNDATLKKDTLKTVHCDHVQINIQTKATELFHADHLVHTQAYWNPGGDAEGYEVFYHGVIGGFIPPSVPMTDFWIDEYVGPPSLSIQMCCNCRSLGHKFYFASTYTPITGSVPHTLAWRVGRLEYDGLVAYASYDTTVDGHTNPYAILLPSCRVWLLSEPPQPPEGAFSNPIDRLPDEPWVIALSVVTNEAYNSEIPGSYPLSTDKLVTGRALNTELREGPASIMVWDGALKEAEVANILFDASNPPAAYPGEDWNDLRVRCYNHRDGEDIALWTTTGPPPETVEPLAVFGYEGELDGADLQHGLPEGLIFEAPLDDAGNIWQADPSGYYTDPGTWTNVDEEKYAAQANTSPLFEGKCDLIVKVEVMLNDSVLTFDARLDNRAVGEEFPHFPINIPATTLEGKYDTLSFYIDGELKWSMDNTDRDPVAETFVEFLEGVTITGISAGPHTFKWELRRWTALNDMKAWIDNVQFPEILVEDDINGAIRWYNDGSRIRKASFWTWPKRDDEPETHTGIPSRVSTVPDFITKDYEGRILYGNPHYICRIIVEGIDNELHPDGVLDLTFGDKGFFRWTASPVPGPPTQYLDENCEWQDILNANGGLYDTVVDPPWGAFQILPLRNGWIQIRGANGAFRDATVDPIHSGLYPDEDFVELGRANGAWYNRVNCWTLKDDGHKAVPHIEVLWRCTMDQPAYPVAPPYDSPPYPTTMQSNSVDLPSPYYAQIRDPRRFPMSDPDTLPPIPSQVVTKKPVWNMLSKKVPRIYGDTLSRRPQFIWAKPDTTIHVPPVEADPDYFTLPRPHSTVDWKLYATYHCPSVGHIGYSTTQPTANHCFNGEEGEVDPDDWHYTWDIGGNSPIIGGGITDFDAVDCDCGCGCEEVEYKHTQFTPPPPP